ncbi:MAG: PAS domain-containing protein, partial [Deltaproteobacteria bacterium]|nr:PAS domain-containing protein [Deltaproteobacteria bacterium]
MAPTHDRLTPLILDSIGEGVFTVDHDFRVTSLNQAAEALTGWSREEVVGMHCHDVFRADICQDQCALRRTVDSGKSLRDVRATILDREMNEIPVTLSTAVLREADGAVVGGVEVMRDISELETLRRALRGEYLFEDIVGVSPVMRRLFRILPDVARSDVPVLIEGPSGTGKEMVAQALH